MSVAGSFPVRTQVIHKCNNESEENGDFFRSVIKGKTKRTQ